VFEIGSSLKEARVRQGLDFAQLETATKIRGKYLQALEAEEFDSLPAETYIKGFLRTYADQLGLDGQLYVDEFNSRFVAAEEQPIRARRTVRPARHRRLQGWVVLATVLGIGAVTALVILAWDSSPPKSPVAGLGQKTTATKPRTHRRTPVVNPLPSIVLRAGRDPVFLIAVRKNSPTGDILFEGKELSPGQSIHFRRRKLWINTGTPEHLQIIIDGRRTLLPGGKPQVFVVTGRGIFAS
jgi:hypothetical protein